MAAGLADTSLAVRQDKRLGPPATRSLASIWYEPLA
jgi:hypothetical protein